MRRTSAFLRPGAAWWKAPKPANMVDIRSVQHLVDELAAASDQLVVVEYYGTWCAGCRALAPLLAELAAARPEVKVLLVDGDENKARRGAGGRGGWRG